MTQLEQYVEFVKSHRNILRLEEILSTSFAAEYRKNNSILRGEGWKVHVELNPKEPGKNLYTFKEPTGAAKFEFDGAQGVLIPMGRGEFA